MRYWILSRDHWEEALSNLQRNKWRALLTGAGVLWGVFMLIVMLGFGQGLERGVSKNMTGLATKTLFIWGQHTSVPHRGLAARRQVQLNDTDTAAIARHVPGVEAVAPRLQLGGWENGNGVHYQGRFGNFGVLGDLPTFARVHPFRIATGRFLNQRDLEERRKVTVIGEQVRRVLFADKNPLGESVQIKGVSFVVVGTFHSAAAGEEGERGNSTLHVPLTTLQHSFDMAGDIGWFALSVQPWAAAEQVQAEVLSVLQQRHGIAPEDDGALGSFNAGAGYERVQKLFVGVRFFIWFVSLATLCAGALGVSNILLISVKERSSEFAVRKALGATPWAVISLVLQEAVLLTTLAGYTGLVLGVWVLEVCARHLGQGGPLSAPGVELSVALQAVLALVVIAILAGLAPAQHAAHIRPVVALRAE